MEGNAPKGAATSGGDGMAPPSSPVTPPASANGPIPPAAPSGAATPPLSGPQAHPVEAVFMAEIQDMKKVLNRVDARVMAINLLLGMALAFGVWYFARKGKATIAAS